MSISLFIAGDSTAANKSCDRYPETGWGQVFYKFLKDGVEIRNYAVNGRSSKSFFDEGRLEIIKKEIRKGDYLFIQFGHNDQKPQEERKTTPFTTYKEYLTKYIDVALKAGANPVLLTSVNRRSFKEGKIECSHGDYIIAMKELAKEKNIKLIDICQKSETLFNALGEEKTKTLFLWLSPNEHPNYPEGKQDNTHFNEKGALEIAGLVAEGIKEIIKSPLSDYLK